MIRLIATDLDGTLLGADGRAHKENAAVLRAATARGALFAIATGRLTADGGRIALLEGFPNAAVIGVNGAHIVDRPFGKATALHRLPAAAARAAADAILRRGLVLCLFMENAMVYSASGAHMFDSNRPVETFFAEVFHHEPSMECPYRVFCGEQATQAALSAGPLKLLTRFLPGEEAAFHAAKAACAAIPGVAVTVSWADNFEIMPLQVNKGSALAELAARRGIPREEVAAFGDSENDIEMLEWAGHGYAMRNAAEAVLHRIPRVTEKTCEEGGVADTLRRLLAQ